jgi:hypothetical protein
MADKKNVEQQVEEAAKKGAKDAGAREVETRKSKAL